MKTDQERQSDRNKAGSGVRGATPSDPQKKEYRQDPDQNKKSSDTGCGC